MNLLEFELVVSVVAVAVVLDLVSTLDAHVLVVVLVRRISSLVLVLGEIVVVVDPCVIVVSMVAMRTVVTHVVFFAAETLSVASVVSDPVVWVHHVWSAHRDRLPLLVIPHTAVPLHPTAHQTLSEILQFLANTCHCFPPVPSPDDEILNRNVHF